MNVIFLIGTYPNYGGVEKVSTFLANEFIAKGHNVSIISFQQPYPELAEKELDKKVRLYKLQYPILSFGNVKKFTKVVSEREINLIINQWCVPLHVTLLCWIVKKINNIKLVSVHHNLPNTNARINKVLIDIEKNNGIKIINKIKLGLVTLISKYSLKGGFKLSDKYIVLSPSFIEKAINFMSLKSRDILKIRSIPNPLTIDALDNFLEKKEKEIIYVGRIEYNQKRNFRLVEIWNLLENKYPDWKFTIVGDGPDKRNLENLIEENGLKKIKIEGFKKPIEYYKRASILLLTSEYEGFGLVLGECMNYSVVPIVYGSYSAVYDIIQDGINGFIIPPPYSSDFFANKIELLINNNVLLNNMRYNAFIKSMDFSIENIYNQWMEMFDDIIK